MNSLKVEFDDSFFPFFSSTQHVSTSGRTIPKSALERRRALVIKRRCVHTCGLVDKASAAIRFRAVDYKIHRTSSKFSACDPVRASVTYHFLPPLFNVYRARIKFDDLREIVAPDDRAERENFNQPRLTRIVNRDSATSVIVFCASFLPLAVAEFTITRPPSTYALSSSNTSGWNTNDTLIEVQKKKKTAERGLTRWHPI